MDEYTFEKQSEAERFFAERLAGKEFCSEADVGALSVQLAEAIRERRQSQMPARALGAMAWHWVIRDDDLKATEAAFAAWNTVVASGGFATAGITDAAKWTAAVGILTTLLSLSRRAATKGKKLTQSEFQLLYTLRGSANGLTSQELLEKLKATCQDWDASLVEKHLNRFKCIPMADGTTRELVVQDGDRWRTSGI